MTALSHQNMEETLARYVCSILEDNQQDSEFLVQDVQYIPAQVKIVKCTVNNIPVDISFNQMAGLSALCFLEQVDQLVGKDHLFKRSIILIKAWCYYESRILGAHHGLISTYAVETLILYIINIFHSSLSSPLAVLYKFLDYYSTFDWENYCISITGPVPLSSLPAVVAETPENDGEELLLSQDFLSCCREMFSIPMQSLEIGAHVFPIKYLNIVDPLKENNNLGRSVSKGNFHRIRCALSYGAQSLRELLLLPGEIMGAELEKFFVNTLDRNGRGQRPDVQIPVHAFGTGRSEVSDLSGDYDGHYNGLLYCQWYHNYDLAVPAEPSTVPSSSQIQKKSAWDSLRRFVRCKRNNCTNAFFPRLPFSHPCALHFLAAAYGINDMTKSRGTGTYIPNMTHQSYRDMQLWISTIEPESSTPGLLQNSPIKTNPVETSLETDHGGNDGCFDLHLSPQEFPLLPGTERSTTTDRSSQPKVKSPHSENCCQSIPAIKFGSYEFSSPIGMHSPPPEPTDSRLSMPTSEKQKQKELCEFNEEREAADQLKQELKYPSLHTTMRSPCLQHHMLQTQFYFPFFPSLLVN